MPEPLLTHPGQLCVSGSRAVDLALALGRARERIRQLEQSCPTCHPPTTTNPGDPT